MQDWARERFKEVLSQRPLNLGKACLLISLEEEAAEASSTNTTFSVEWTQTSTGMFATLVLPDMRDPARRRVLTCCRCISPYRRQLSAASCRWQGDPSTWSLRRLDNLAAEARSEFQATFDPSALQQTARPPRRPPAKPRPQQEPPRSSSPPAAGLRDASQPPAKKARRQEGSAEAGSSQVVRRPRKPGAKQQLAAQGSSDVHPDDRAEPPAEQHAQGSLAGDPASPGSRAGPAGDGAGELPLSEWHRFSSLSLPKQQRFMRLFPMHCIAAVNTVFFERMGYARMQHHGDPRYSLELQCLQNITYCRMLNNSPLCRQALLNHVLEQGTGCPAALAILYSETCARMGVPMHTSALDGNT